MGQYKDYTDWYLVVVGQFRAVLHDTWWYGVSIVGYWLLLGGTASVWGGIPLV